MAKELTRDDIIKKQYSELNKINQRLKNISECYYISYDGTIYMKSLVPFVEKMIHLRYPEKINLFYGAMVLPNQFFDYAKKAKKTKMTIKENTESFEFGQEDDQDVSITVNIVNTNEKNDEEYRKARIIPKMYKRFFELGGEGYISYKDCGSFSRLNDEQIDAIANANPVVLSYNDASITLTKHLMLDIKKDDVINISRNCYHRIDSRDCRVFYMLKNETDLYDCYTIFNTLQQISE